MEQKIDVFYVVFDDISKQQSQAMLILCTDYRSLKASMLRILCQLSILAW